MMFVQNTRCSGRGFIFTPMVGLYKLNPVDPYPLKAPGFNP
jgi:hypothetical protein